MQRRRVGAIVLTGGLIAACAADGDAVDDRTDPATTLSVAEPAPSTTGPATARPRETATTTATSATTPGAEGAEGADAAVPTTSVRSDSTVADEEPSDGPSTTLAEEHESADAVEPAATLSLEEQIAAEDFEPSFEIGPPVEIDVDVARFPVDDAGLGGGGVGTGTDGVDSIDESLTGWAAFNAALEASLVRPGNTSAAVAVMIGGDLVNAAAFGVRDVTRPEVAEPTDRYRVASISKPITAIVALELVEQGLVGLDDPIGEVIAQHVGADRVSGGAARLTLRRLLTHTSGFGKFYNTFFQLGAEDCADAARQGLARASGSGGYTYSNMNYCLAGMLVEAVTGESLERATYRLLLTPLGIGGMRLAPTFDPGPGEAQHVSTPGRAYMETLGGAGSWIASPIDLVTIVDSLDHDTSGFKPLEPLTVLQMSTPQGGTLGQRGYGLGLISYGDGRLGHTGTIEATHAMVLDRGDGVVWAVTVAGNWPAESERLEQLVNAAFEAGGFVSA